VGSVSTKSVRGVCLGRSALHFISKGEFPAVWPRQITLLRDCSWSCGNANN